MTKKKPKPKRPGKPIEVPDTKHAGLTVRRIRLQDANPHPDNPRVHPEKGTPQWEALRNSLLSEYFDPLVWNALNGMIVSGHYRRKILMDEGFTTADMVVVDWDEPTHKARMLAANELLGNFDDAKLRELLLTVGPGLDQSLTGITDDRLAELMAQCEPETPENAVDAEPQIDKAEDLRVKWGSKTGQIWALDEHRLMCGDSTNKEDVERLMAGQTADACITDPPYGISFNTDYTRFTPPKSQKFVGINKKHAPVHGDDKPFDPTPYLAFDSVVLWGANYFADKLPRGTWLIWDKRFANGKAWLSDAELAWMKTGTGVYILSLTSQGMVRPEPVQHPTQKAVALIVWCIEKSKAGLTIFEPFSGSGTTIIACENLHRRARAMEIAPGYVAVALQRWSDATGKTPVLL